MVVSNTIKFGAKVLLCLLLAACASPSTTPAPPTNSPAAVGSVLPTATLQAETIELGLSSVNGEGQLLGLLVNQSAQPVEAVELILLDPLSNQVVSQGTTALPWIAPGGASPFLLAAPEGRAPASLQVVVAEYTPAGMAHLSLEVSWQSHGALSTGAERWTGWLAASNTPARIDGIAAIGGDRLAEIVAAPSFLSSGQRAPIEIELPVSASQSTIEVFLSASPATRAPFSVEAELAPGWQVDPQGGGFIVGSLIHRGQHPIHARIVLGVEQEGRLQRAVALESPIPLAPGEVRPFGVRLDRSASSTEELPTVTAHVDAWTSAAEVVPLAVEIIGAESPGSSVLLIGSVHNPAEAAILQPMAFVSLRGSNGALWSAAWHLMADRLAAGETAEFIIELPLAADIDARLGEWDVRALGLAGAED